MSSPDRRPPLMRRGHLRRLCIVVVASLLVAVPGVATAETRSVPPDTTAPVTDPPATDPPETSPETDPPSTAPPATDPPGSEVPPSDPVDSAAPDPSEIPDTSETPDGEMIPRDPQGGGQVEIDTVLRDTYRSTGESLQPTDPITVANCASVEATDPEAGTVAGDDACAPYRIVPSTLVLQPSKTFFADTNGNWSQGSGEYAVVGDNSPVSAIVTVRNDSAFPVSEVVITEPSGSANEFGKFDASKIRLTFPDGATQAVVTVTYEDGTTSTETYTSGQEIALGTDSRVASVSVRYTGVDENGAPTIQPGSSAALGLHGTLNDAVDDTDLPGGTSPGIENCADVTGDAGRGDGTGTFAGSACATLPVESPRDSAVGVKTASQTDVPPGQPVTFTLRTTNNGNRPLVRPMVSDPPLLADGTPDPAFSSTFDNFELVSATTTATSGVPSRLIEVYVGGAWVPYAGADLSQATGVRATADGNLPPTERFSLVITLQRRETTPDGVQLTNCYQMTAGGDVSVDPWCTDFQTGPVSAGATLNKVIDPPQLPQYTPGLPAQEATVSLTLRNTGNLSASSLQVTDDDADFFDAVDFVGFGTITAPAGANRVTVDALVDGAWVTGSPTVVGSPTLPAGVAASDVRGVRFTFSSTSTTNGGFVITPCTEVSCEGAARFVVSPRATLVSDPDSPVPDQLDNTVFGEFATNIDPPGESTAIPENSDGLELIDGTPQIDVDKGPDNTTLSPGEMTTMTLTLTNNGTAAVPDPTIVDLFPAGLAFDETFDGGDGQPYTIEVVDLPDGVPAPPAPTFDVVYGTPADHVDSTRWTFDGWIMPVGATVRITIRVGLAPGVSAGDVITNTMGASSSDPAMECTAPDAVVEDGDYGSGRYCTDPANVTARAGATFTARKWVAGNPDLGWFSPRAGNTIVPVGGGGCPTLTEGGITYTSTPCVALVNPGEQFQYLLRVVNAGTEPASRMVLIDNFPAPGDTGVLGDPRGTEWDNRPTLAGAATYSGPSTGTIGYTSGSLCSADLALGGPGCPAGSWDDAPGASTTAFRVSAVFDTPLPPAGSITVTFAMDAPTDVTQVSDPTIAWNSFSHAEATVTGSGSERILPPISPIKTGVATAYGVLEVVKEIGDNPAGLDVEGLTYEFAYECTLTNGTVGRTGTVTATVATPGRVTGIPGGATCDVWETGTNGAVPSATEDSPVSVEITPSVSADPIVSSVTVTNDFPMGTFSVAKLVTGEALDDFTGGPFTISVDCAYNGTQLDGYPVDFVLAGDESDTIEVPVGATCTVVETDDGGATTVSYDPAGPADDGAAVVPATGDYEALVTVTNDFSTGSLVIVKDVIGAGVPSFSGGPFEFDVTCSYGDLVDVPVATVTIDGSADGSTVQSDPVTGIPVGSECVVTETDSAGADFTPVPVTMTIDGGEDPAPVQVDFLNPFSAGTIAVSKTVSGEAATSDYVAGLTFVIHVECAVESGDGLETLYSGDIEVAGDGQPVQALEEDGNPVLFPVNTRCWANETATGGATSVTNDHASYETGTVVIDDPEGGPQNMQIDIVNVYDPAVLVVSKVAVNEPATPDTYTFTVECTAIDVDGSTIPVPLLSGASPFTLASGESASFDTIAGATCVVTETGDTGATVTFTEDGPDGGVFGDDPADGVVIVDATTRVDVTNTFGEVPQPTTTTTMVGPAGPPGTLPVTR